MLPRGLRGAPKCHRCRHHHLLRKDFQVHRPCRSEGLLDNYRKRFQKVHRRNLHPQTYIQWSEVKPHPQTSIQHHHAQGSDQMGHNLQYHSSQTMNARSKREARGTGGKFPNRGG
ncbi:uncharacterized protein LOC110678038 isoform X1 [Aedes aegypti]|uniref:Uncharacterized protein n=1 Tax=Aedes aegypti TaxID=7159 RepID=A0A6I8U2K8_AEDAE|nr:uncharacterized protein LOC110678038 isoform X1 [Aedes aegypti]